MIETPERRRRRGASAVVRRRATWWLCALVLAGCDAPEVAVDTAAGPGDAPPQAIEDPAETGAPEVPASTDEAPAAPPPQAAATAQAVGRVDPRGARNALERAWLARTGESTAPAEIRRADRATMIYADPRFGAPFRGKLTHGEAFGVYERVASAEPDPECRG
ncbi:MAG: hypothetical protein JNK45_02980, partial [Myxococcales bacterium]|nr:hypothetical protein [Myxococcales bacterium]